MSEHTKSFLAFFGWFALAAITGYAYEQAVEHQLHSLIRASLLGLSLYSTWKIFTSWVRSREVWQKELDQVERAMHPYHKGPSSPPSPTQ